MPQAYGEASTEMKFTVCYLTYSLNTEDWQELFLYAQGNSVPISQQTNNLPLNIASLGKSFAPRQTRFLCYVYLMSLTSLVIWPKWSKAS